MPNFDGTPYTQLTDPARNDVQGVIKDVSESNPELQTKYALLEDLLKFGSWASKVRTVTATGTVTLLDTDPIFIEIDPNGSDRDVSTPSKSANNHGYFILHAGSANTLTIKRSGGTTITTITTGQVAYLMPSEVEDFNSLSGGGGGGLTNSIASVTTANITGVSGTRHILDVSGMTANRNFILPAGVAGDEIEVNLSVGDATYALILIGNTGISINGETAATEWSRLFISGETVRFVATSTSNWQVVVDGRIPCKTKIKNTGTQNISTSTTTVLTLDELDYDNASCADTANNRIIIRRTNKYIATAGAALDSMTANATRVALFLRAGGSPSAVSEMSALAGGYPSPLPITTAVYAAGTVIDLAISQNCGSTEATYVSNNPTHLEITEVLP